jgi:hypothetical protein
VTSIDVPDRVAADKVEIGKRAARVDLGVKAVGRFVTRVHSDAPWRTSGLPNLASSSFSW